MAQPEQPGDSAPPAPPVPDWAVHRELPDAVHGYLRDADVALEAITAVVDLERVLAFTCERVVSAALFGESLWQEVAVTDGRRLILWHGDDEEDEEDPGRLTFTSSVRTVPLAAVVDQGLRVRYGDGADGARELHAVMLYLSTQTPERSVTELTEDAGTRTMQYVETYRFAKSVTDGGPGQMRRLIEFGRVLSRAIS